MYLKVNLKTKVGLKLSQSQSSYITTRSSFEEEIKALKKKYSKLNFQNSSVYKIDGSIELNVSIVVTGVKTSIFGSAERIEEFRLPKSKLKCEVCGFSLMDFLRTTNSKIKLSSDKAKQYIGQSCKKCNSGFLKLYLND